ncbi:MAG: response regulator [Bryobacteraceae bacterium]|jgi:CheY-like chemotaxis protein
MATLLVVDDEAPILKVITYMLRSEHSVITAESGIEALAIFESYPDQIDLIVTDVTMPGMSGLELVARLEALHSRRFPVLFITGASEYPIDADRAVLRKPFSPTALKDMVRQLLQACRGCREHQ